MVTFQDGPAAGVHLGLRRDPLYLRVVRAPRTGEWDALDQLDDEPKPKETIHVYRRVSQESRIHFKMQRRSESGYYARAVYALHDEQPDESITRNKAKWQIWCVAEVKKLRVEK